ncbi:MAG: DUF177 domain-containing protein [Gemmatimonadaceae bacterium]|nr:DUF177 domain-containing protein [Gemmatimonadaceae bacterium]
MLLFDIRTAASKAVPVDGTLERDDAVWIDGDTRPAESVHVTGRLSPAGQGTLYFSGQLTGEATAECRRCLADARVPVTDDVHLVFAEAGTEGADDPDVYPLDAQSGSLDLRPAVREQWLLAAPAYALCREDCKGLCSTCGADLNAGPCSCQKAPDPRWAALSKLTTDRS